MLEAQHLSKTYVSDGVDYEALKDVDLSITRGDCVAIVGKSGSGKSTLLNRLVGSERAIVTSTPGTTRDILRETVEIGGLPVMRDDEVVGMITETDLFKIFLELMGAREPGVLATFDAPARAVRWRRQSSPTSSNSAARPAPVYTRARSK